MALTPNSIVLAGLGNIFQAPCDRVNGSKIVRKGSNIESHGKPFREIDILGDLDESATGVLRKSRRHRALRRGVRAASASRGWIHRRDRGKAIEYSRRDQRSRKRLSLPRDQVRP